MKKPSSVPQSYDDLEKMLQSTVNQDFDVIDCLQGSMSYAGASVPVYNFFEALEPMISGAPLGEIMFGVFISGGLYYARLAYKQKKLTKALKNK